MVVDCESQAHPEGECTMLLSLYSEFDVGSEAVEMMVAKVLSYVAR